MSSRSMRSRLRVARRVRIALGAVLSAALAFAPLAAAPAAAVGEGFTVSGTVYVGSEDRLAAEGEVRIAVTASTGTTTYGSTTTAADGTFSISGLTAPYVRIVFDHLGPRTSRSRSTPPVRASSCSARRSHSTGTSPSTWWFPPDVVRSVRS